MKVYIPNCYVSWLQTTPPEGQVLIVAFLAKLHGIYGTDTYFEMYNEDLDIINHTAIRGTTVQEVKKLKTLGLINQANGIALRVTLRLSESLLTGLNRHTIFTDSIPYDLSLNGTMLWVYLMGRIANVDADVTTEIIDMSTIRQYKDTKKHDKYRKNGEKTCYTHILPIVYKDVFQKEVGKAFVGIKEPKPLIDTPERKDDDYHKWYYQMRKNDILQRKRDQYHGKKDKE